MTILHDAIQLLTEPPGDLVYFLVTLFALQQALIPALTARRAAPEAPSPRRWLWAVGGMLLGRAVLIVVGLLGSAVILDPVAVLPPLERLIEVSGIALVVWAMTGAKARRWQTVLLLIVLAAAGVFYAIYDAPRWPALLAAGEAYNGSLQEWIWEIAAVTLLSLGLLIQIFIRLPEWEWAVGVLVFWLLGHVAQLLWPTPSLYFADWERLSTLVALPLLAAYVHRVFSAPVVPTAAVQERPPSARSEPVAMKALDVTALQALLEGVESSRELEPALIITSSRLARFMNADICVIGLTEETDPPQVRAVATHPPTGVLEAPLLDLAEYDVLVEAWIEGKPRTVQSAKDEPWLEELYRTLGFADSGPLLALPMHAQGERIGLLLLGNPESDRSWEPAELTSGKMTAALLAMAILRVQRRGGSIFSLREPSEQLQQDLTTAQARVQTLESQLARLEQDLETREAELARLRRQLEEQPDQATETELEFWQQEVQELAHDREVLIVERDRLGQELAKLRPHLQTLVEERRKLKQRLVGLTQSLEAMKIEVAEREKSGSAQIGLLVTNEDGQIRMADPLARKMLRLPDGEVTWTPIDGAYPTPEWTQMVDALLADDPSAPRQAHLTLDVGSRTVEADLITLMGRDGKPDGLVVTLHTEESVAEQQEAIIGIANEFRTPMTSITGYTDLLMGEQVGILTEMQQQFLGRVKANVEQMGQILNDLIRIASPDARAVELEPQPVDLVDVVEQGVMGLAARFRERNLQVKMDLPPELPPVRADRDSLYQIMLRLLSNAALCSKSGTEVVVGAEYQEPNNGDAGFVRICVTDTGGGIASEDIPKVFRRFYRAHQPLIEGMGERGVGMAVARTLVEANGGRIWVDSNPGEGSTFSFVLPIFEQD